MKPSLVIASWVAAFALSCSKWPESPIWVVGIVERNGSKVFSIVTVEWQIKCIQGRDLKALPVEKIGLTPLNAEDFEIRSWLKSKNPWDTVTVTVSNARDYLTVRDDSWEIGKWHSGKNHLIVKTIKNDAEMKTALASCQTGT